MLIDLFDFDDQMKGKNTFSAIYSIFLSLIFLFSLNSNDQLRLIH